MYGEIVVKQFEAVQTGLPLCTLGGLVTPAIKLSLKYSNFIFVNDNFYHRQQVEMLTIYSPWALKNGLQSKFFMNVYFERYLEDSIEAVRKDLNISSIPSGSLDCDIWNKKY